MQLFWIFSTPDALCVTQKSQKGAFSWGSAPDPAGGFTTLPRLRSRLGRRKLSSHSLPFDAFGAFIIVSFGAVFQLTASEMFSAYGPEGTVQNVTFNVNVRNYTEDNLQTITEIRVRIKKKC